MLNWTAAHEAPSIGGPQTEARLALSIAIGDYDRVRPRLQLGVSSTAALHF